MSDKGRYLSGARINNRYAQLHAVNKLYFIIRCKKMQKHGGI